MVKEKYDLCFGIPLVGGFLIVFIDIVNHNGGGSLWCVREPFH